MAARPPSKTTNLDQSCTGPASLTAASSCGQESDFASVVALGGAKAPSRTGTLVDSDMISADCPQMPCPAGESLLHLVQPHRNFDPAGFLRNGPEAILCPKTRQPRQGAAIALRNEKGPELLPGLVASILNLSSLYPQATCESRGPSGRSVCPVLFPGGSCRQTFCRRRDR